MSFRPLALILTALLAAPALAEEIVHFKNGTTMPIRSHNVEGEMVHVDMGADALMAFPVSQIDKIVAAGKNVFLQPSSQRANVGVGGGDVKVSTSNPNNIYPAIASAPASSRRAGGNVGSSSARDARSNSGEDDWQLIGGAPASGNVFDDTARRAAPKSPNRSAREMIVVGRRPHSVSSDGSVPFGVRDGQRRLVTSRDQLATQAERPVSTIAPKPGLGTSAGQKGKRGSGQPAGGSSGGSSDSGN